MVAGGVGDPHTSGVALVRRRAWPSRARPRGRAASVVCSSFRPSMRRSSGGDRPTANQARRGRRPTADVCCRGL